MEKQMIEKSDEFLYNFFKSLNKKEAECIGLMGGRAVRNILKSGGFEDTFINPLYNLN